MSLKTYLREHAPAFQLLEPLVDLEDPAIAHAATLALLKRHPDLVGIYSAGGGTAASTRALRDDGAAGQIILVGNELTPGQPLGPDRRRHRPRGRHAGRRAGPPRGDDDAWRRSRAGPPGDAAAQVFVPFDLHVAESF